MTSAMFALLGLSLLAAPPKTTHLYPTAITRGAFPVLAVAEGDIGTETKPWTDDSALKLEAGSKAGQFLLSADPDCRVGWHVVRLHNKEGVTEPIPIWVDDLPNLAEKEPNNAPKDAALILDAPQGGTVRVHGRLERNGDVDGFRVHVPAGRTLTARVQANRQLNSPMDATLQIADAKGFVLAHNDDARGVDPEIVWTARESSDIVVRLFSFPTDPNSTIGFAGGSAFVYALSISTGPTIDFVAPVDFGAAPDEAIAFGWNLPAGSKARMMLTKPDFPFVTAQIAGAEPVLVPRWGTKIVVSPGTSEEIKLTPPVLATGQIAEANGRSMFLIEAKKGENWNFRVFAKSWESPLDPVISIRKADGSVLVEQDDSGNNNRDADLAWAVPDDGLYRVDITDLHKRGGPRFVFGLEATRSGLPAELNVANSSLTVKPGDKAELSLTFDKRADIDEPVKVTVEGLPKGFPELKPEAPAAAPPMDQAKRGGGRRRGGNAPAQNAIKIPVTITAEQAKAIGPWSGPVRFVATDASGKRLPIAFAAPRGPRMGLDHVWMTVVIPPEPPKDAKKEEPKK